MENNKERPLKSILKAKSIESSQHFSEGKMKIYEDGIESVSNSGVLESALKVGDKAINFTLKDQMVKDVTLYDELKKGPIILTWYRGGWCPYCNISLSFLQKRLSDFKNYGASLFALTPELPNKTLSTSKKHNLKFKVLSDIGNEVGRKYGLIYKLTKDVAKIYSHAFNMIEYNGDESYELPLAATYVIGKDGIIKYAFLDADYKNRAEPDDIIEVLQRLKKEKQ